MKRVDLIYHHPVFQERFQALQTAEQDRRFCRHTLEHLLDVARLMYIYALEEQYPVSKELIYATALMHDIGRMDQIECGTPHEQAGAALCEIILPECGYSPAEIAQIKAAILCHRSGVRKTRRDKDTAQNINQMIEQTDGENGGCSGEDQYLFQYLLGELLYRADKQSRNCYACAEMQACNWDRGKMNLVIEY